MVRIPKSGTTENRAGLNSEGDFLVSEIKVTKPDAKELESLNIKAWSPWECEPSTFDWEYDSEEWCYLFEGDVKIKTSQGETDIRKGDLVKLPKGLKCTWNVKEKVRKVYIFK